MKRIFFCFTCLLFSCAHSKKESSSAPERAKGYGDFLFMPPGSIAIRNFVDVDGDGVDDRYQLGPKEKALPMGHFYKNP